jgi:hypothetical protein
LANLVKHVGIGGLPASFGATRVMGSSQPKGSPTRLHQHHYPQSSIMVTQVFLLLMLCLMDLAQIRMRVMLIIGVHGFLRWIFPSLMDRMSVFGLISVLPISICILFHRILVDRASHWFQNYKHSGGHHTLGHFVIVVSREFEVNTHIVKTMELLNLSQIGSLEDYNN